MMFFMWLFPLLVLGLIIYLVGGGRLNATLRPAPVRVCANCQRAVQNDWKVCPHCGQTLS